MKFIFLKKKRLPTILYNSLYSTANLFWTVIISYIVIKWSSVNMWGEFMALAAIITLGTHFVKWGNKTYLLKEFSANPSNLKETWNAVFMARIPIFFILLFSVVLYFFNNTTFVIIICLWILSDFIFTSFEAHLIYFKKFKLFFLIETIIILISIIILYFYRNIISLQLLIILYTVRLLIKALMSLGIFINSYKLKFIKPSLLLLKKVSPFFFIGLLGLLNSKIDFYSILFFLNDDDIGKYHILSNFVLFGITIGSFIIIPFEKNIYRLTSKKVNKIAINFFTLGIFISCSWMLISKFIISKIYQIELPIIIYIIGILYILPIYYYWPILHKLYAKDKTVSTLKIGLISVLVNLIFNILLIPVYGILGALISTTIGQIVLLTGYVIISRKDD